MHNGVCTTEKLGPLWGKVHREQDSEAESKINRLGETAAPGQGNTGNKTHRWSQRVSRVVRQLLQGQGNTGNKTQWWSQRLSTAVRQLLQAKVTQGTRLTGGVKDYLEQ